MGKTGGRSFSPLWIRLTSVLLYESSRQFTWYSRGITNLGTVRHCFKTVRIRSYSDPHFSRIFSHSDWIRRDTKYHSVFSPNAGKCGKNADQNNSEYAAFLRSVKAFAWMNCQKKWLKTYLKLTCGFLRLSGWKS